MSQDIDGLWQLTLLLCFYCRGTTLRVGGPLARYTVQWRTTTPGISSDLVYVLNMSASGKPERHREAQAEINEVQHSLDMDLLFCFFI